MKKKYFYLFFVLLLLGGLILRLYQLGGQIVWDDEFHAVRVACDQDIFYILSNFHWMDNCIPLTAYYKFFLTFFRLNEFWMRSLPFLAGVILMVAAPLLMIPRLGRTVALIFLAFLAGSPLLIYYSRYARPYSLVVMLVCLAFWCLSDWFRTGNKKFIRGYLAAGTLAVYFFLPVLVALLAPLGGLLAYSMHSRRSARIGPIFNAGLVLFFLVLLIFLPAWHSLGSLAWHVNSGRMDLDTLQGALYLINGTRSLMINLVFIFLAGLGLWKLFGRDKMLTFIFLTGSLAQFLLILFLKPNEIDRPIVLVRYCLIFLPFWLLLLAVGLKELAARLGSRVWQIVLLVLVGVWWASQSPLIDIYRGVNNFTNHADFQYDYRFNPRGYALNNQNLFSEFYLWLSREKDNFSIIEMPYFDVALLNRWPQNTYNFYQFLHQKRVYAGLPASFFQKLIRNKEYFSNVLNVEDLLALKAHRVRYVEVHINIFEEAYTLKKNFYSFRQLRHLMFLPPKEEKAYLWPIRDYLEKLAKIFGPPIYRDKWIRVFYVKY